MSGGGIRNFIHLSMILNCGWHHYRKARSALSTLLYRGILLAQKYNAPSKYVISKLLYQSIKYTQPRKSSKYYTLNTDITKVSSRIASLETRLFAQYCFHANNKENIKLPHYRTFVDGIHSLPAVYWYKGPAIQRVFPCHGIIYSSCAPQATRPSPHEASNS